jgi:cation:H+ antiporter
MDVASFGVLLAGLCLLVGGAEALIRGSAGLAARLGISPLVIGLTVVAFGTSSPEVPVSVASSVQGQPDLAVGNVVGSNIFNLLGVLGLAALPSGGGLPVAASALSFDLPVMVAVMVACLPVFFTGHRIARWEGALFLAYHVAYVLFLVLDATNHDALPLYSNLMLALVLPLTVVTLADVTVRAWRHQRLGGRAGGDGYAAA